MLRFTLNISYKKVAEFILGEGIFNWAKFGYATEVKLMNMHELIIMPINMEFLGKKSISSNSIMYYLKSSFIPREPLL